MALNKFLIIPLLFFLISCSRESAEYLYKKGEDLWSKGEVELSIKSFLKVVDKYPDNDYYDDALFRVGEIYYLSVGEYTTAIKYFTQLTLTKSARTKLQFQAQRYIAEIYENSLKNYDMAIIEYQRLINNFENWISPDVGQFKIANCYYKKGDYEQAIVEYEILTERFPVSRLVEEAIFQMVTSYFILGNCSKAVDKYNTFNAKFPESKFMTEIHFEIGSCYEEEGDLIKSLKIFGQLKESYPNKKLLKMKIDSIKQRLSARKR